jgi:hypothetical protein
MIGEFMLRIVAALEAYGIPYMLTGSLASSMYGVPRATNDVDIVIAPTPSQLTSLIQLCIRLGLHVPPFAEALTALRRETQVNVIDFANSWKADLIIRKEREFSVTEFNRRQAVEAEEWRMTIATAEDVLLAKLEWAKMGDSERQLDDAAGILRIQGNRLDLAYIEKWVGVLGVEEQWLAIRKRASEG